MQVEIRDRSSRSRDTDIWSVQAWSLTELPTNYVVVLNDEEDVIVLPSGMMVPFEPAVNPLHMHIRVAIEQRVAEED